MVSKVHAEIEGRTGLLFGYARARTMPHHLHRWPLFFSAVTRDWDRPFTVRSWVASWRRAEGIAVSSFGRLVYICRER